MPNFYSPMGNYEIWAEKPDGYFTSEEWAELHPAPVIETSLEEHKEVKKAEIAAARYSAEIVGIEYEGNLIATDRDSQALITGAALAATLDSAYTLRWKMENGEFIQLTSSQIIAIAQAVRRHVQECFDKEATLVAQVEAATDKTALSAIIINF